jgi:multidrug efflux pump subunit AcrA (membrane-fusion protein)
VLVLTISANGELALPDADVDEVEVLDPPRLPVVVPEEPPAEDPVEDELPLEVPDIDALPVEPADTASPGERPASDTIVPLIGAYSYDLDVNFQTSGTLSNSDVHVGQHVTKGRPRRCRCRSRSIG